MSKLQLSRTPPLPTPMRFLLTAPLFGVAAGLVAIGGGEPFTSRWMPGALAFTHLITLGYLTMVMVGALFQVASVLIRANVPHVQPISRAVYVALTLGAILLSLGFLTQWQWAFLGGVTALALALFAFIVPIVLALLRAEANPDTALAVWLAIVALIVTFALGIHLGMGHALPQIPLQRQWTDLHVIWGLLGWVGLLVVGVSYEVVPMFQLTPHYPERIRRPLVWGLALTLLLWSIGFVTGHASGLARLEWLQWPSAILLVAGYSGYALLTLYLQTQRKKPELNVTLWFWRLGMVSMVLSLCLLLLGQLISSPVFDARYTLALAMLFLIGTAVSLVNGMLYKIIPFLAWLHLTMLAQSHKISRRMIPQVKDVIEIKGTQIQFALHLASLIALVGACLWPGPLTIPAGIAFTLSNALLWWNLIKGMRLYKERYAQFIAEAETE